MTQTCPICGKAYVVHPDGTLCGPWCRPSYQQGENAAGAGKTENGEPIRIDESKLPSLDEAVLGAFKVAWRPSESVSKNLQSLGWLRPRTSALLMGQLVAMAEILIAGSARHKRMLLTELDKIETHPEQDDARLFPSGRKAH